MLLFKGTRDQLLGPLQSVSGIVEKRHTLPILSNVLIENKAGDLTLVATDIEIQITTKTKAETTDSVSVTVAAKKLQDILKSLPDNGDVSLDQNDKRLQIRAGKSRFNLQTLEASDFPLISAPIDGSTKITVQQKGFRRLLSLVQYAMAQQDIRYYLNGLLLSLSGKDLRVIATDGHRLAFAMEGIEQEVERKDVILPRKTVLELSRQLSDSEEPLEIEIGATQVLFRFGSTEIVSKLIEGKFPDYERVIPQSFTKSIVIDRQMLLSSLQRVAILTNDKFRAVRILLSDGSLKLVAKNSDQEEAEVEVDVDYQGEALDIGFNVSYLLDFLTNIGDEKVECRFTDAASSALMLIPGKDSFKYVVMPMRI